MDTTCICGREFILPAHAGQHQKGCIGPDPTPESLRDKFCTITDSGCWEWQRKRNGFGYGLLAGVAASQIGERKAHRASLKLTGVDVSTGNVLHSCDNPPCINPAHLRVGTQRENALDTRNRGRGAGYFVKLPPDIRTCPVCGTEYSVSPPGKRQDTCSRSCASKQSWVTAPSRKSLKHPGQVRSCAVCSTEFIVSRPSIRTRTCSPRCTGKLRWITRSKN